MRFIKTTAKLISVWLFVILVTTSTAVAQSNGKAISISLSVSSTQWTRDAKPRATITVKNQSGSDIPLKWFRMFQLSLQLKGRPFEFCRIDECYSAAFFPHGKVLPNNAEISLVAKLYDVYWHNSISSIRLADNPRNLFTHVPPGDYDLVAKVTVRADDWKPDDPRAFVIKSNVVSPVIISRAK